jgi:hypothetical protein
MFRTARDFDPMTYCSIASMDLVQLANERFCSSLFTLGQPLLISDR